MLVLGWLGPRKFRNGVAHGFGHVTLPGGDTESGEFVNGLRHGKHIFEHKAQQRPAAARGGGSSSGGNGDGSGGGSSEGDISEMPRFASSSSLSSASSSVSSSSSLSSSPLSFSRGVELVAAEGSSLHLHRYHFGERSGEPGAATVAIEGEDGGGGGGLGASREAAAVLRALDEWASARRANAEPNGRDGDGSGLAQGADGVEKAEAAGDELGGAAEGGASANSAVSGKARSNAKVAAASADAANAAAVSARTSGAHGGGGSGAGGGGGGPTEASGAPPPTVAQQPFDPASWPGNGGGGGRGWQPAAGTEAAASALPGRAPRIRRSKNIPRSS